MADATKILAEVLRSPGAKGLAGGLAGGLLVSRSGRKLAKKAAKLGGLALVGGLAYAAWQRHRQGAPEAMPPGGARGAEAAIDVTPPPAFLPASGDEASADALALLLLRAMIAAARADGKLDATETDALLQRIDAADLPPADKALLLGEMRRPVDLDALAAAARSPEVAAEIYAASLLAIDVDTPAERAYLSLLAARLGLSEALVAELHDRVEGEAARADVPPAPAPVGV